MSIVSEFHNVSHYKCISLKITMMSSISVFVTTQQNSDEAWIKTAAQQSRTTRAEGTDRTRRCLKYLAPVPNYYMTCEREVPRISQSRKMCDMFLLKYYISPYVSNAPSLFQLHRSTCIIGEVLACCCLFNAYSASQFISDKRQSLVPE